VLVEETEDEIKPIYIIWNSGTVQEWEEFSIAYGLEETYPTHEELLETLEKLLKTKIEIININ